MRFLDPISDGFHLSSNIATVIVALEGRQRMQLEKASSKQNARLTNFGNNSTTANPAEQKKPLKMFKALYRTKYELFLLFFKHVGRIQDIDF